MTTLRNGIKNTTQQINRKEIQMAFMNGCNSHMGGVATATNVKGRYTNDATARNSLSKAGVNKDLGGGATPSGSPGAGKINLQRAAGSKQLTKGAA